MAFYAFSFFTILLFSFFSIRLFKRKISLWATCTTTNEHAEETPRHGAFFPSRDTQRYHFGRVASKMRRRGGAEHKIGDDEVARLSGFHMTFLYFSFLFFSCLGF